MAIARQTYKGQAYQEIRQMLIDGELAPGAKVVVRVLSEQLSLSPTPIKSALAGLERDGFLVSIPHRGYFVPEVAVEDMREIYELREALDGIAARNAASMPDAEAFVRDTLRPLYEKQRLLQEECGGVGYSAADVAFHRAIWHMSGNARLSQFLDNLGGQLRFASGSSSSVPGRIPEALDEHAAIMAAIAAGDAALAEELSRAHVRRAAEAFGGVVTPGSPAPYRPTFPA
ncbi:GntR family transcriptional regulator [Streptomyces sp. AD681]|uniref:GntR family transcriptional regulator n=1 Tax=Streptomyces sp. AD681 TaxID=3019069 RepID=UPI0022F175B4|nr:GntR family transcriptional regulator [Streptomyces sp. AD681]MDA5147044.1 GntR family transcriptional regulator [Streptomyces sp. AD681]